MLLRLLEQIRHSLKRCLLRSRSTEGLAKVRWKVLWKVATRSVLAKHLLKDFVQHLLKDLVQHLSQNLALHLEIRLHCKFELINKN